MTLPFKRDHRKVSAEDGKPAPELGSTHGCPMMGDSLVSEGGKTKNNTLKSGHGRVICRWINVSRMRTHKRWEWARRPGRSEDAGADPLRSGSGWRRSPQLWLHSRSWPGPSSFSHLPLHHISASRTTEKTDRRMDGWMPLPVNAFKIKVWSGKKANRIDACKKERTWNTKS